MPLHPMTFSYLQPTERQKDDMACAREAAAQYVSVLEVLLPDGPDKTWILREIRTVAMWVNGCITRNADGSPRDQYPAVDPKDYPPDHPAPGDLGSVPL